MGDPVSHDISPPDLYNNTRIGAPWFNPRNQRGTSMLQGGLLTYSLERERLPNNISDFIVHSTNDCLQLRDS